MFSKNRWVLLAPCKDGILITHPWWHVNRNKFIIVTNSNAGEEFKLHDGSAGPAWTFGIKEDRWWGDAGSGNLNYDGGGS
ncbi:MAG: hypothetical protein IPK90_11575 [Chitinophagaceae bacterium]|nr:hypothetical protein [Chitinophagaceae bacterium]